MINKKGKIIRETYNQGNQTNQKYHGSDDQMINEIVK